MAITRLNVATSSELSRIGLGRVSLRWTQHAKEQATRKGLDSYYTVLQIFPGSVVEIEESYGRVTKYVIRLPHDSNTDKVLVLVPDHDNVYVVVTVWKNDKHDTHKTLRMGRISQPSNENYRLVYAA